MIRITDTGILKVDFGTLNNSTPYITEIYHNIQLFSSVNHPLIITRRKMSANILEKKSSPVP